MFRGMLGWFWGESALNLPENADAVESPTKNRKIEVSSVMPQSPPPKTATPKSSNELAPRSPKSPPEQSSLDKDIICVGVDDFGGTNSPSKDSAEPSSNIQITDEMIKETMVGGNRDLLDINRGRLRCGTSANFYSLKFSRSSLIYSSQVYKQREHKRVGRSRHDAWRRYGALLKIHELGGWSLEASLTNSNPKNYVQLKPKTKLSIAPPNAPPIMTEEEMLKRPLVIGSTSSHRSRRRRSQDHITRRDHKSREDSSSPPKPKKLSSFPLDM